MTINTVQYTAYKSLSEELSQKALFEIELFQNIEKIEKISGIRSTLKALVHLLKESSFLWKTDNYASTFIVNSGSSKDDLWKGAKNI